MAPEPKVNILSPRSTRQQPSQKRALPPRHSFLTEAVEAALQKQQQTSEPQLDSNTILIVTNDENTVANFGEKKPLPVAAVLADKDLIPNVKRRFVVADKPPRRQRRAGGTPIASIEPIPEEYYLRRHRKHEKEEKKQKNREKERLQHEMYQQQQFVERVRHTDKSMVLTIATAICHQQQRPLPNADSLYRQVLQDAEEQLSRYEMLGLTLTRKPRTTPTPAAPTHHQQHQHQQPSSPDSSSSPVSPTAASHSSTLDASPPRKASPKSSRSTRRSIRNALAFGHKIPSMHESEFQLPYEQFGYLMERRARSRTTRRR